MSDADAASAATAELSELPFENNKFEDHNSDKSSAAGQRGSEPGRVLFALVTNLVTSKFADQKKRGNGLYLKYQRLAT